MIVIATGPRSNGTSLLYRIIATGGGKTPLHLPAYPPEFRDQDWATDFPTALFVVMFRARWAAAQSLVDRGLSPSVQDAKWEQILARSWLWKLSHRLRPRDAVCMLTYEALVEYPETVVANIDRFLRRHGYSGAPLSLPEPIVDGNAKWLEAA